MKKENEEKKKERIYLEYLKETEEGKALSEWYRKRKTDPNTPCPQDKIKRIVFYTTKEYELLELHHEAPFTWTRIGDFNNFIERYFDTAIETFKRQNKREPSLQEFKKYFSEKLKSMREAGYCYAVVHNNCNEKEFKKFITAKRGKSDKRERLAEVERYLKVYRLKKQGKGWDDIIKAFGRGVKQDSTMLTLRPMFIRDYNNAKKIIENLENDKGFPIY